MCVSFNYFTIGCPAGGNPSQNVFSSCGASSLVVNAPMGVGIYIMSGPTTWPGNGATTQSVSLTSSGSYTLAMYPFGVCYPILKTFTLNNTPAVSVSLTSSQSSACVGGSTIALSG